MAHPAFQNRLIRPAIELGIPVEGLKARFKTGTTTAEDVVVSQVQRENVITAIGNMEGVEAVDDRRASTTGGGLLHRQGGPHPVGGSF